MMPDYPFHTGLLVGRFQTIHKGHEMMLRTAANLCQNIIILVGSSQESGTATNPYSYALREEMLHRVAPWIGVEIYPLPDLGVGNNNTWGSHVFNTAKRLSHKTPELLISGKEDRRISWFDNIPDCHMHELYLHKTINMSATQMRQFLVQDNQTMWRQYTPPEIWHMYDQLKAATIAAQSHPETASM